MNDSYRIKEIARLYGLCADTLRYYEEQGILSPERGENNYRQYRIQDICNLNVIRELRGLDLPMERIREYITTRDVASTLKLMEEERRIIDRRIRELRQARRDVERRAQEVREAAAMPQEPRLLELPARPCYQLSAEAIQDDNMDFLLKKLEKKHEAVLQTLDDEKIAAVFSGVHLGQGEYGRYSSVLLIAEGARDWDVLLPAGSYASMVYRGAYSHQEEALRRLMSFVEAEGLRPLGDPLEIYHIDAHETLKRQEYVTELQIRVEKIS